MESYSVIQKNEVLIHDPAQRSLENMLYGSSQLKKATYWMVPFTWDVQLDRSIGTESKVEVVWGLKEKVKIGGKWRVTFNGYRVSFGR